MENKATCDDLKKHLRRVNKRENVSEIQQFALLIFLTLPTSKVLTSSNPVPIGEKGQERTFKMPSDPEVYLIMVN